MSDKSLLQDAIKRLIEREPRWKKAIAPPDRGAKPPSRGKGLPSSSSSSGEGSGINESDYALRQYWPTRTITSSDGIFTLTIKPIKSIALEGGVTATFKEPSGG